MILQCTQKAYHGHCFSLLQETKKWKFRFGWRGYSRNLREGPNVKGKRSRGIIYNWNRNRRAHHTWNNDRDIDRCTPVCLTYAHVFIYGQGDRTGMPWGSRVLLTPTPTPPQHNHTIFWLIFFFFFFVKQPGIRPHSPTLRPSVRHPCGKILLVPPLFVIQFWLEMCFLCVFWDKWMFFFSVEANARDDS